MTKTDVFKYGVGQFIWLPNHLTMELITNIALGVL